MAPLALEEARALLSSLDWLRARGTAPSPRAFQWLEIKAAALDSDADRFVRAAIPFMRAGRGRHPVLWYSVAHDIVLFHRQQFDGAMNALDEIVVELASAPKVPACMRLQRAAA
jgi:hypothetical protein